MEDAVGSATQCNVPISSALICMYCLGLMGFRLVFCLLCFRLVVAPLIYLGVGAIFCSSLTK
jgi:hypothetical protein